MFLVLPVLRHVFPASGFFTAQRDRLGSIYDTSGGHADVDGELPASNAEGADSVSRAPPVVSCAGCHALVPVVSTAAAFPGSRLLRVLGGGHSADHGGCSGTVIAACSSGVERLRRQACCNFRDFVGVFDSLSSHHVDRVRSRSVCGDGDTNSSFDTHHARAKSWGTLHAARSNSGGHVNSYPCTYNSCGGVRGGTKPRSISTGSQVGCLAVEKLASLQQAPGRLDVETWAGRDGNPSLPISQVVEIMPGCGYGDSPSPSSLFFRVTWGRAEKCGMGWVGR